jgi:dipeptidyl-peptidase-4
MNNGELYCLLENDSLNLYSYTKGEYKGTIVTSMNLIPNGDTSSISMHSYTFSNNEKRILFATGTERIYRHSNKSEFYLYDIDSGYLSKLSENGKQQFATFSPDDSKVAFVRDNNLIMKDLITSLEYSITTDGQFNSIINGAADWVYEEEFGFSKAFFWSPDSKKIAFYRFDESNVKEFQMTNWGDLYPEYYKYKYPKAGEDNSIVQILVYDIDSKEITPMDIGEETDIYIPRISWTQDPQILSIQWMNRLQNELKILLADANTGISESVYHETNKYYIDITDNLTFLKDNEHFIFTSEQDGFHHIYLYDMLGNLENQVTSGEWVVNEFLGVDEDEGLVYFISSESSPLNRELYVINLDGNGKKKLSEYNGNNNVRFSEKFNYYINTYSDANTPSLVTLHNAKGKLLRTLKDNQKLKDTIKEYKFSKKEFFTFITDEGVELNGWMMKPYDFDPAKKYPVLMYVYGGPDSQTVQNSWNANLWYQYLVSQGLIIVSVDNRGTGSRGEEFKKMTYKQLGKYETIDQIEAAKYLGSLNYIDRNRIGIWGWSYGGYMSTSCLAKGADYFSMAIAVAPVTNWRYYDNIYTERFMRTPQENPEGYDDNSPINHVEKIKGALLVIHGTADDNVHFQNSVDFTTALVEANVQFEMQFYPNSNHGIYTGQNTTLHLYTKMTDFIRRNLIDPKSE